MFITHQQDREQYIQYITTGSKSIENLAKYKYLGMGLTYQNYIQKIIKNRLNLGECLQPFASKWLSNKKKYLKAKMNKTIILRSYGTPSMQLINIYKFLTNKFHFRLENLI
jgi:hypothetical protein